MRPPRWPWLLASLVLAGVSTVGVWFVVQIPDEYEARSTILFTVEEAPPLREALALPSASEATKEVLRTALISVETRSAVEQVARKADLDLLATTQAAFDELLARLESGIRFAQIEDPSRITIAYRNEDPETARRVVAAVLELIVDRILRDTRRRDHRFDAQLAKVIEDYAKRIDGKSGSREAPAGLMPDHVPSRAIETETMAALYQDLVRTRERRLLAGWLNEAFLDGTIEIIEPPRVPSLPVDSNRTVLLGMATLAAGLLAVLCLVMFRRRR